MLKFFTPPSPSYNWNQRFSYLLHRAHCKYQGTLPYPSQAAFWAFFCPFLLQEMGDLPDPSLCPSLIFLLQLCHGMCSGISLTFQICTHTVLAEVLLFFSNTSFSFLLLLGEKLSSFKNWENWQKSCGGIVKLGGINGCCQTVPYILIAEWSCQTWQAARGRFPLLPFFLLFPLLPSWRLLTFQATNGDNTSWSFWVLHVTNPKYHPTTTSNNAIKQILKT